MNTPENLIEELAETRSVDKANHLLRTGWRLLTIVENRRGHIYILRAVTAFDAPSTSQGALSDAVDHEE